MPKPTVVSRKRAPKMNTVVKAPSRRKKSVYETRATYLDTTGWFADWLRGGVGPGASGETVSPRAAMGVAAYFAAVRNISEDVAKVPKKILEQMPDGSSMPRPEHALWWMIHDEPNPDMSSFTFFKTVTAHALGYHGGFAEIGRTRGGLVYALWPLDPTKVTPKRNAAKELVYEVRNAAGTESITLPARDVIHIQGLAYDGVTAYALSHIMRDAIGTAIAAQKFRGRFFKNSTVSSCILTYPGVLSPDAQKVLADTFHERHSQDNAWAPIVLEEGTTANVVATDGSKAQMIESQHFDVEEVCRMFRINPNKLQHWLRTTFSNVEESNIDHINDTIMPWWIVWEQELNRKIFMAEERGRFRVRNQVTGLLRGKLQDQADFSQKMIYAGVYNQDEVRSFYELPPLPNGKGAKHWIGVNMMSIEDYTKPVPAPPVAIAPVPTNPDPNNPAPQDGAPPGKRDNQMDAVREVGLESFCAHIQEQLKIHCERIANRTQKADFSRWLPGFWSKAQSETKEHLTLPILQCIMSIEAVRLGSRRISELKQRANDIATEFAEWMTDESKACMPALEWEYRALPLAIRLFERIFDDGTH